MNDTAPHHVERPHKLSGRVAAFPRKRFLRFLEHCKIVSKEFGLQPFRMLGTQMYILDEMCKGVERGATTFVILKSRQIGCSTFFLALDLFWSFEHAGLAAAFATHTDESAAKFRAIIDVFLSYLPSSYRVRHVRHNRNMLILQNGSMFSYLVAGTRTGKGRVASLGRSSANNYVHATEVAYWGNEDDVIELKATTAQHNPHRLQIWESTANGFNHWEDMWRASLESPAQCAIFVGWWRNELFRIERDNPLFSAYYKDSSMSALERSRARAIKDEYDWDIEPEQVAWYRWCLEDEQHGDQAAMDEKYPWTSDDAFQATGSKFFTNAALTQGMRIARKTPMLPYRYRLGTNWFDTELEQLRDHKRAELKIYEEPQAGAVYTIGCDPAYGSSDENDSTALCVLRCYADVAVQVAEYASKRTTTYECAWILAHLAGYYRNVRVNLEITGPGNAVQQELVSLKRAAQLMPRADKGQLGLRDVLNAMTYFLYRRPDSLAGEFLLHTKTTTEIKEYMCNAFRDSFQLNRLHLKSLYLLEEMKTIVRVEQRIAGSGDQPDDRFMAAVLAHQAWKQWEQTKLIALGRTMAKVHDEQTKSPTEQRVQAMVINYLKTSKIAVPGA